MGRNVSDIASICPSLRPKRDCSGHRVVPARRSQSLEECSACHRGHEPALTVGRQATSSQRIKEKVKARYKVRIYHVVRDFSLAGLVCIRGDLGRMDLLPLSKFPARLARRSRYGSILSGFTLRSLRKPIRKWSWWMGRVDDLSYSTLEDTEQMEIKTRRPHVRKAWGQKGANHKFHQGSAPEKGEKIKANIAEDSRNGSRLVNSSRVVARILLRADHGGCEYYCSENRCWLIRILKP